MGKGVHYLFRYRDVSLSANSRYLDALSIVIDPTARVAEVDRITRRKRSPFGRTARAFNPISREDLKLFQSKRNPDVLLVILDTVRAERLAGAGYRRSGKMLGIEAPPEPAVPDEETGWDFDQGPIHEQPRVSPGESDSPEARFADPPPLPLDHGARSPQPDISTSG
jgi:hypothetical protein